MNIILREITSETVGQVIDLSVRPDQQQFVAPNATSLAEALFSEEAWYRAIYDDEIPSWVCQNSVQTIDDLTALLREFQVGFWRCLI
jgi:diamine N-acetyltransferase